MKAVSWNFQSVSEDNLGKVLNAGLVDLYKTIKLSALDSGCALATYHTIDISSSQFNSVSNRIFNQNSILL